MSDFTDVVEVGLPVVEVVEVAVPGPQSTVPGPGVPEGGDTGQVLTKLSPTDFDTEWVDAAAGGGAVDSVNGQTGVVVLDAGDVGALPDDDPSITNARTPTGAAGGVLSGTYPNPGFAADMATQAELDAEAATRLADDATIVANIANEATTRSNADNALDGRLDTIEGDYATATALASEASTRATADATEVTNRNSAIATAIANLIATAPGTLDTLDEIAAALGDDPNFAATITTALAGKASTSHAATHKGGGSDVIDNATTLLAGLMAAADKAKLDGIEANATADQTAAEILAKLLTVDGSGSGLDADLLDGNNSSAFETPSGAQAKSDAKVDDTAYDATSWNGVTGTAPSKNAVRDKVELLAPLASPALTGTPTVPTAAQGTNTTQAASTAYVQTEAGLLIPKSLVDAKGDLIVGTANDTVARLPVGTNGAVLTADSTATAGVSWRTIGIGTPASATTSLTASTKVLQGGTLFQLATNYLAVGQRYRWHINITKTAAGTNTWDVSVCFGTAGDATDAAIATWTSTTNTGAADQATIIIECRILTLGAAATAACTAYYVNGLSPLTGLGRILPVPGSTATFNSAAANPYMHVDFTTGTGSTNYSGVGMAEQIA